MRSYLAGKWANFETPITQLISEKDSKMQEINILTSFHYFRRVKIKDIRARFPGAHVNVFADSGGFSAATQGASVRLGDYVKWLQANMSDLHIYANLDVIGDPIKTKRNQLVLESEGLAPIPVFHVGSDFKHLDEILERYEYIALGGMVPYIKDQKQRLGSWIHQAFKRIEERATKVHGFGLGTSWNLVKSFPWHSIDSSAWTSAFQFRAVSVFDEVLGKFEQIDLGKGSKEILSHGTLLRRYGFSPSDFWPPAKFSYVKAGALSVMSVLRAERHLSQRPKARSPKTPPEAPGFPFTRVHGFGIGSWPLIKAFPWASVDSSSASYSSQFRNVFEWDGRMLQMYCFCASCAIMSKPRKVERLLRLVQRYKVSLVALKATGLEARAGGGLF